jgi:hypothetical protein
MLYEKGNQVGRYIKALRDRPDGGVVKQGEIGQIIGIGSVDFPSQKDYCISTTLDLSKYELLPVDYVSTPPYVARSFPSDKEYIKLIVKHDILRGNREHVQVNGDMPSVIPKGTVTWCTKYYKSNILNNNIICIEGNKYCANINSSCFEVHPDSKHLFEESKVVSDSIKEGDTVRVVHVSPTDEEWKGVGKVPISFKIGDIVTVSRIGNGYKIDKGSYYPRSMFEKVDKKELSIDSTPPVSEPIEPTHKFKVGDSVVAVNESHGWGEVKKGDIGVVKTLESDGRYYVDFPNQKNWIGTEECFRALQYTYTSTISTTDYSKLVETIWKSPITDVETIGIQLTKKSKTKLLSI